MQQIINFAALCHRLDFVLCIISGLECEPISKPKIYKLGRKQVEIKSY